MLWTVSQGLVKQYPIAHGQLWPTGLSGDGNHILGWVYPDAPRLPHDASFNGAVTVGAMGGYPLVKAYRQESGGQPVYLGDLPGGDVSSRALAVSADGKTVVGFSSGENFYRMPFRWTAEEGVVSLGSIPGALQPSGVAQDVSGDGSVIVGKAASANSFEEAFRWTKETGMQPLGDLPGNFFASEAFAVSRDGKTIVGKSYTAGGSAAFIWDEYHGMRKLADVLRDEHNIDVGDVYLRNATGISADGRIVVGWGMDFQANTFAWRADLIPEPTSEVLLMVALGVLPRRIRARGAM
jgi:probable HAF family extracellular repeat protein